MRITLPTTLFAVCAFAAMAGAQAGQPATGNPTQTPGQTTRADSMKGTPITVQGCITRNTESATAGATGTAGSTGGFLLSNAVKSTGTSGSSASSTGSSSTSGTAGSSASSAPASTYRLDVEDAKVTAHVGHKVEITGTVDESASSSAAGARAPSGSTASSTASAAARIKVDNVRMISATCP